VTTPYLTTEPDDSDPTYVGASLLFFFITLQPKVE
jgi:hypothetical protein